MNYTEHQVVMGTANAYIQAPGILSQAGERIRPYGTHLFIVSGEKSWKSAGGRLEASLAAAGMTYELHLYRGECSYEEVERLKALMKPIEGQLVAGVGGGKVTDLAKALAYESGHPFISVPTIAATCAPVANLSIMYSEAGVYIDFSLYPRNTLLALVDTDVIARSPARYLAAGIGDTIAKWYEARVSALKGPPSLPTAAGLQMARLCLDTLLEVGEEAVRQVQLGESGESLQKAIDSIILISGAVGGFGERFCRSAAGHAIHNGLTVLPESHHALHGEKVAYGILVQLVLEQNTGDDFDRLVDLYRKVGLPCSLADMGIHRTLSEEELQHVAKVAISPEGTMNMMPFEVTEQMVVEAMRETERFVQQKQV